MGAQKVKEKSITEALGIAYKAKGEATLIRERASKSLWPHARIEEAFADRIEEEAIRKSQRVRDKADIKADKILDEAYERADRIKEDADDKCNMICEEANDEADLVMGKYNQKVKRLQQKAQKELNDLIADACNDIAKKS